MAVTQLLSCALLVIAVGAAAGFQEGLRGHQIWELPSSIPAALEDLLRDGLLDSLSHSKSHRKVHVPVEGLDNARRILKERDVEFKVLVDDLAEHFQGERRRRREVDTRAAESCTENSCPAPLSNAYMTFTQMEYYLREINTTYAPRVSVKSIGKSVEGRDIWMVHVRSGGCAQGNTQPQVSLRHPRIAFWMMKRRAVWIEGGLHAREWISPAVALRLVATLAQQCSVTQAIDVYIVPMANPDGYVYSWASNRLWRKNRRPISGGSCDGVDLNRNWSYRFGVGASSNPCSEVYKGQTTFSEPETQALRDAMTAVANGGNLELVVALHSYGQVLMYPWGWTAEEAPDTPAMKRVGEMFASAAEESSGTVYSVVNSASGFYYASGATDDWAKGVLQSKYVYTLELRDEGAFGFYLQASQILPTAEEVWQGLRMMFLALTPEKAPAGSQ
ncbi:carboxypeptidase B-like isoform X1 [Penaeus chinensis]|uniref:carboxypeptidase B-like isoform X1 n=1 Tax=Penaeus chinensis TaxID=139456 RepID=UPI001FB72DFC|nr:carboxypeptidase B-like isoform X1 [Penaeus chinensis]